MESATLHTVAEFPAHSFLENLAVRGDNSILVTSLNHRQRGRGDRAGCVPCGPQ